MTEARVRSCGTQRGTRVSVSVSLDLSLKPFTADRRLGLPSVPQLSHSAISTQPRSHLGFLKLPMSGVFHVSNHIWRAIVLFWTIRSMACRTRAAPLHTQNVPESIFGQRRKSNSNMQALNIGRVLGGVLSCRSRPADLGAGASRDGRDNARAPRI
jgi:hypothetical protein